MSTESPLKILIPTQFYLDSYHIEVESLWGQFLDIYYFKVSITELSNNFNTTVDSTENPYPGLLRVGKTEGSLNRESTLRQCLGNHRMVGKRLTSSLQEKVIINLDSSLSSVDSLGEKEDTLRSEQNNQIYHLDQFGEADHIDDIEKDDRSSDDSEIIVQTPSDELDGEVESDTFKLNECNEESEYLEEESYELESLEQTLAPALVDLIQLPDPENSLAHWLNAKTDLEDALPILIQFCQFANYLHKQGWCFTQINPALIHLTNPIQFYDVTGIFKIGEVPNFGITGLYCPPELALGRPVDQQMSSFVIAALLYQIIHHQPPQVNENISLFVKPIPGIYQILQNCLVPGDDRPPIAQILSSLVELQQLLNTPVVHWSYYGQSTLGLAENRWKNEDHYGVRQQFSSNPTTSIILGLIADGMGGMAQGEVASQLAIQTLLTTPIPTEIGSLKSWNDWLVETIQQANKKILKAVRDGGTTLSLILAVGSKLLIAHVGDSRIFLIRNKQICQLSQDHSLVSTLFNAGEITQEEMQNHPDRSVLTKSLGSNRNLPKRDIQTLETFGEGLSIDLQDQDTLLLCSDGIWDLISESELCNIFLSHSNLSPAVNQVISQVIDRGASDNATLLALSCSISPKPF